TRGCFGGATSRSASSFARKPAISEERGAGDMRASSMPFQKRERAEIRDLGLRSVAHSVFRLPSTATTPTSVIRSVRGQRPVVSILTKASFIPPILTLLLPAGAG